MVGCYQSGFLAFFNQWKLIGGQIRNSGKALLGAPAATGGKRKLATGFLAYSLREGKLVPYMGVNVGVKPGSKLPAPSLS